MEMATPSSKQKGEQLMDIFRSNQSPPIPVSMPDFAHQWPRILLLSSLWIVQSHSLARIPLLHLSARRMVRHEVSFHQLNGLRMSTEPSEGVNGHNSTMSSYTSQRSLAERLSSARIEEDDTVDDNVRVGPPELSSQGIYLIKTKEQHA